MTNDHRLEYDYNDRMIIQSSIANQLKILLSEVA